VRGCELEDESIKARSLKLKSQKNRKMKFGYKDLDVWNRSDDFEVKLIELIETIHAGRKHYSLFEQMDVSSTSASMNLAEGEDGFSQKEFKHYLSFLALS
jgi:hypothetical protein